MHGKWDKEKKSQGSRIEKRDLRVDGTHRKAMGPEGFPDGLCGKKKKESGLEGGNGGEKNGKGEEQKQTASGLRSASVFLNTSWEVTQEREGWGAWSFQGVH